MAEAEVDSWTEIRSPGRLGAALALTIGVTLLGVLVGFSPFGFDASALVNQPAFLAILLGVSALLGWRLAWRATRKRWWSTVSAGLLYGLCWSPVAISVAWVSAVVDATGRDVFAAPTVPQDLFILAYGVAIFSLTGAFLFVPIGLAWALVTRMASRVPALGGRSKGPGRSSASTAGLVVALLLLAVAGGAAQTLGYAPWNSSCIDLPGGTPTDAAFSPSGDLLAVALGPESGSSGTVLLMRWPSRQAVATWSAVADGAVAVGPDGHVYWSSSDFDGRGTGIVSALPGGDPELLVGPDQPGLDDLTWTQAGLLGVTADSHAVASVSFVGPAMVTIKPNTGDVGAFWSSSDGTVMAFNEPWSSPTVVIDSAAGTRSEGIPGSVLSIAMSPDHATLIAAAEAGGLRTVDLATGRSRQVMSGSQAYIALSDRGDIAWSDQEPFGPAKLCTSTLARLGAGG